MAKRVYGVEKAITIIAAVASAGSPKEAKLELASGGSKELNTRETVCLQEKQANSYTRFYLSQIVR